MDGVAHFHAVGVRTAHEAPLREDWDTCEDQIIRYETTGESFFDCQKSSMTADMLPHPFASVEGRYIRLHRIAPAQVLFSQKIRCVGDNGFHGDFVLPENRRVELNLEVGEEKTVEYFIPNVTLHPTKYYVRIIARGGYSYADIELKEGILLLSDVSPHWATRTATERSMAT